jgi:hypothetical protein
VSPSLLGSLVEDAVDAGGGGAGLGLTIARTLAEKTARRSCYAITPTAASKPRSAGATRVDRN